MPIRPGRRPLPPPVPPPAEARPARPPVYVYVVRRSGPAEIITIAVLVAIIFLLGVGLILWAVRSDLAFGPTPTPTPTAGPPHSPTPDFGATRVAEEMLTQTAYQAARLGTRTPTLPEVVTPDAPGILVTRELSAAVTLTPTQVAVMLPGIVVSAPTPVPTSTPLVADEGTPTSVIVSLPIGMSGPPTPTFTPTLNPALATATPTETPTVIPTDTPPFIPPTPTPTPTFTLEPPTPTPPTVSPTPTATGLPYVVGSLNAVVRSDNALLRLGPSTIYTATNNLGRDTTIQIYGRTRSGEWVSTFWDNRAVWLRQATLEIRDNSLPGIPEGANPNDVRWLAIRPVDSYLQPLPQPTPIPGEDYPLLRYTRDAQGRLPQIPNPPVNFAWPAVAQASQALISPAVVGGSSVVVASADNHLYSFDRLNGNQRWRNNLGQSIRQAPAILDGRIYVATDQGQLIALEDRGNESVQVWNTGAGLPAVTSFNVYSDTLFVGVGQGGAYRLLTVDRDNGAVVHTFPMEGATLRYPAVGDQLVYAASGRIAALDVFNHETVWTRDDLNNITAGPVYSAPGVRGLAELYIVDGGNRIFCLDANTGRELWNYDNGEPASGLAVNDRLLLVSGNGYVKAITRDTISQIWRAATAGPVLEGVWADNSRIMALTQGGTVQFFDAANGNTLSSANIPAGAGGAGAVSGPWVFVPGTDGSLYALRAAQ